MIELNLGRLLNRKEVKAQITSIQELSHEKIAVCDINRNVVFGERLGGEEPGVPILAYGEIKGWVYGGDCVTAVAKVLGYVCSSEMDKRALGQETLDKYKELSVLYGITERLSRPLNQKQVANLLIQETQTLIEADRILVYFFDEEKQAYRLVAEGSREHLNDVRCRIGTTLPAEAILNRKAEIMNDIKGANFNLGCYQGITSMMCVPLTSRDQQLGLIEVASTSNYAYTANDLKILSTLAFQASIAVDNVSLYETLKESFVETVYALAAAIEKRDPYTGGHTVRVMDYSVAVGEELGLLDDEIESIRLGAILHDIGKIGIKDDVLMKSTRLTDDEYENIKSHTEVGRDILSHVKYLHNIMPAIYQHHERFDGGGYPSAIEGAEIDLIARIIGVTDAYDAMTSNRLYRKALHHVDAMEELWQNAGRQFDPQIVVAFEKAYSKMARLRKEA